MNKKTDEILWFYPLFSVLMIITVLVALIMVGAGFWSVIVPIAVLLVSEIPVFRYKLAKTTRTVAEFDWLVMYLIGMASSTVVFLSYLPGTTSPQQILVVGLVVGFLTYIKMTALTSYNRLGE